MSRIVHDTGVTLLVNGENRNFTWESLALELTRYDCPGGVCQTAIATAKSLDIFWLIFAAVLVFFMKAGFTFLEVGSVQMKNTKNILIKNLADLAVGAVVFYALGYGFAFGDGNGFIGEANFFLQGDGFTSSDTRGAAYDGLTFAKFLLQWAKASTASTIISGAIAERVNLAAYLCYSCIMTAFIYPVVAHWAWSDTGFVSPFRETSLFLDTGAIDFAGAAVVHVTGGMAALVGCVVIGARRGRFAADGKPLVMTKQSPIMQTLGVLILWFGWYGFNCGATLSLQGYLADVVGKIAVNTTLSAAISGLTTIILNRLFNRGLTDPSSVANGIIAGLVGISAGCATVDPYGSIVIGFVSAIVYFYSSRLMIFLNIDDVVDAAPVHLFCGIWGTIAAGLFSTPQNVMMAYGRSEAAASCGIFYTCQGNSLNQFGANMVLILMIMLWTGLMSFVVFSFLTFGGWLRISAGVEEVGLDQVEHGTPGSDDGYHRELESPSAA